MPVAMTYASLQDDARRYLERGDTLASDPVVYEQLPRLINLAERRCARELKIEGFINVVSATMIVGQSVYAKPDRWKDTVSINFGAGAGLNQRTPLFTRGYEFCRAYWPDESVQDVPLFYADYDVNHWLIVPTPDAAYPFEALFYQQPVLLDDANQTNWLTEYAPDLLLYATLLEASPFLKNDERVATWQGLYDRAAAMLNGEDLAKILDRAAVRKEA